MPSCLNFFMLELVLFIFRIGEFITPLMMCDGILCQWIDINGMFLIIECPIDSIVLAHTTLFSKNEHIQCTFFIICSFFQHFFNIFSFFQLKILREKKWKMIKNEHFGFFPLFGHIFHWPIISWLEIGEQRHYSSGCFVFSRFRIVYNLWSKWVKTKSLKVEMFAGKTLRCSSDI